MTTDTPKKRRPGQRGSAARVPPIGAYYRLVWGGPPKNQSSIDSSLSPLNDSPISPLAEFEMTDSAFSFDFDSESDGVRSALEEEELATKMLQIQSKRFYLDVKQNRRGRFIKIAEVGAGGRKSRLLMSMAAAADFRDHLISFRDFHDGLGPPNPENATQDGRIKSESMLKENRRYYLDLKENSRGRFLRVTQMMFRGQRNVVVIPAQGLAEFNDSLSLLLEEYSIDESNPPPGLLPEGRQFRVENKMFYFDIGQNNRGIFLRVSEVKPNFRTAITIPEKSWGRFRDYFDEICSTMSTYGDATGDSASNASPRQEEATSVVVAPPADDERKSPEIVVDDVTTTATEPEPTN